ncbi:oligomeric golgi complex component, COG2-domain-containing protein [Diplogelasinospora grovesii]|uniref:Conserved oligomeric Golgi complex subunit 2 n=1 Tax=Diplogelasinospora grovesii TaxID=303347 RepID=A0AAN6NB74_9PEZI|nr:oligomeric golgi complex component, COG2-domain-containing protein [Diplogelasinospora grovesii]
MAQLGIPSPAFSRPASSSYGFNLPSSSASSSSSAGDDDDDDEPLPFPAALARRDFLAPDFDPAAYLSALHSGPTVRHQTLEDLRTELRDRSSAISAELLELVNSNYTSFLSLGDELKGGEERVEDVRVALLGFKRAILEVQSRVRERRVEVGALNEELRSVKSAVETGRSMLELDERVTALEARLAVDSITKPTNGGTLHEEFDDSESEEDDEDEEEDDSDDDGFVSSSPGKLVGLARDYIYIDRLATSIGRDTPFVKKMEERIMRCRNTILLDLSTALKEARKAGTRGQGRIIRFLAIYRLLDAQAEAVRVLKEK